VVSKILLASATEWPTDDCACVKAGDYTGDATLPSAGQSAACSCSGRSELLARPPSSVYHCSHVLQPLRKAGGRGVNVAG